MPTIIVYPSSVATNIQKLHATYALVEQMRLEHNRQGEVARSDPKYKNVWHLYGEHYHDKIKWLLHEQNLLKEKIRKAKYPDIKKWNELVDSTQDIYALFASLYGDPSDYASLPTLATSQLLSDLKAIDLDKISPKSPADPTEDFTTYTEVDSGTYLSQTAARSTWTNVPTDEANYVYYDKGANHFDGDFEHLGDGYCDHISGGSYGWAPFYAVANMIGTRYDVRYAPSTALLAAFYIGGGTTYYIYTVEDDSATSIGSAITISVDTQYWFTIKRDEAVGDYGTFYCYIYDDSDRTNLIGTSTRAIINSKKDYRYIYSCQTWGANAYTASGWHQNLDLQEVTEKSSSDSGSGADAKASGNPLATLAGSDTGSGADAKASDNPQAGLTSSETGSGADALVSLLATLAKSDSGSGADARLSFLVALSKADSGSGVDSLLNRFLTLYESGSGVDAAELLAVLLGSDSGSGVEAILERLVAGSDLGSGADLLASLIVALVKSDSGSGADSLAALLVVLAGLDSGTGVDTSSLLAALAGADSGAGTDASSLLAAMISSETGLGTEESELITSAIEKFASDSGLGLESVLSRLIGDSDTGAAVDNLVRVVHILVNIRRKYEAYTLGRAKSTPYNMGTMQDEYTLGKKVK